LPTLIPVIQMTFSHYRCMRRLIHIYVYHTIRHHIYIYIYVCNRRRLIRRGKPNVATGTLVAGSVTVCYVKDIRATCPCTHTSTSKTAHIPDYALNTLRRRSHTLHSRSIIPFNNRRTARRSTNQRSTSGGVRSPLQPSDGSWMSCAVPPSAFGLWRANHGRSDTMAVIQDALTSCLHMSHTRHCIYHASSYHTHY